MFSSARKAFCIRAKVPSPRLRLATFIASTMAELRNSISEARPTRFWFWQARTSRAFTMTRTPSSQSWWEPVRRAQFGQSLTISHPFLKNFILSGEIWHFTQPFLRSNAVGNLWAVSYTARKTLVFDLGFNHGLTGTSTHWEAFAGFTYLLPHRLWSRHGFHLNTSGGH